MKRCIGIVLLGLTLNGCGSGGDREPFELLQEPEFDLTGRWVTTAIDCVSFSTELADFELEELDGHLEYETLQSPGTRVVQLGNDLALTDLETGRQWDGTISGDQIRYSDSDQRDIGGLQFEAYLEAEGTVLEETLIVGTHDMDWTFEFDGRTVTGGTLCTGRMKRADPQEPASVVRGDADHQPPFVGRIVVNEIGLSADHWGDDLYELGTGSDAPSLEGDVLTLVLSYSGGCARHDFTLVADSRFQEADPVWLNVHLAHDAHGDPCEAYPTNRYEFDLMPVRMLYQDAYGKNEGVIILRLMGPAPSARFPDLGFALPVTYELK
ncbi:MAG: hypothetical protein OXP66_12960 [Candidatus Tectomicrobia bacterium]|nr:hypothetical protein [Candidatus Tectomicrobia bacterium]